MLERNQVRRYHLGERLHPEYNWWEHIDISQRTCWFWMFRRVGSIAALICEDLARIEPVQSAIRSVGPSLVIALLMDGPQLMDRWSNRYATVLADDPGSAVLTVTSMGLLRRQALLPGEERLRQIGLWKGADLKTIPLELKAGHHAMLLTLSTHGMTNYTLDGRSDEGSTFQLFLSEIRHIRHPDPCPDWAKVD
jgi:hypothetical protein